MIVTDELVGSADLMTRLALWFLLRNLGETRWGFFPFGFTQGFPKVARETRVEGFVARGRG